MNARKRYSCTHNAEDVKIAEIDAFLADIVKICDRHGLVLAHEDYAGSFTIADYSIEGVEWILSANENCPQRLKEMKIDWPSRARADG